MRVVVDHSLCEGHAKCMENAPGVFEVRDDDLSYVLVTDIPEEQREAVTRAVQICPRRAIQLEE
jgi:ferredoxin